MKKPYIPIFLLAATAVLVSCEESFLEKKPDKALVVPTTLEDLQALLGNDILIMNQDPALAEIASDDFYTTTEGFENLSVLEGNSYLWAEDVYEGDNISDWGLPYEQVFYANVVLEGLDRITITSGNRPEWERTKGGALFYRAMAFYNLAKVFALPYDKDKAASTLGIPLRLEADVNIRPKRASQQETYGQILSDLEAAVKLLPDLAAFKTQPSKATVFGLAARVSLSMHDYEKAGAYADSCLQLQNTLMDYNEVDGSKRSPFPVLNGEVIFHSTLLTYKYLRAGLTILAPELYSAYDEDDLRRTLFFTDKGGGQINFRGSYNGNVITFSGLTTDEVYLIRAECRARQGDIPGALEDLNMLLETRWKEGTFVPFTAASKKEALDLILMERRKELVGRGLRWEDLRRLNQYPEYARTLKREIGGKTYTLAPGDPRYVFPIPDSEIKGSGIVQNPR